MILPRLQFHKRRLIRYHYVGVSERGIFKTGGLAGQIGHIPYNHCYQQHEDLTPHSDSFFLDMYWQPKPEGTLHMDLYRFKRSDEKKLDKD